MLWFPELDPDGQIKESTSTRAELRADEVFLKILAAGLCGTDAHFHHLDMVLGHEGVGVVQGLVRKSVIYDAETGLAGDTNTTHANLANSAFQERKFIVTVGKYMEWQIEIRELLVRTPSGRSLLVSSSDGLSKIDAAPMMCAGATVFSALKDILYPGDVGVLGMGGLGHLAIQFAAKQGSRVVVFSQSEEKRDDALNSERKNSILVEILPVVRELQKNWMFC